MSLFRKRVRPQVRRVKKTSDQEITIHNMNLEKPYQVFDVRCDRESPLGSPFYLKGNEAIRDDVCDAYSSWFEAKVLSQKNWQAYEELMRIRELYRKHGKLRIFCWCSPRRCHTQTIAEWLKKDKCNDL